MATSLPPVKLPSNTWVDLYAETSIVAGTQLIIQNLGASKARVSESATEPTLQSGYNSLLEKQYLTNDSANVGAWAYSHAGTILQVEEA